MNSYLFLIPIFAIPVLVFCFVKLITRLVLGHVERQMSFIEEHLDKYPYLFLPYIPVRLVDNRYDDDDDE